MESIKKYVAEVIGTFVLVLLGCGTAMLVGCDSANGCGYVLTALAFGLVIVGMAYCIGNISGCHINPAVSLGVLISGGMTFTDFVGYVVSQCVGAIAGTGVLKLIFDLGGVEDMTGGYGANGLAGVNGSSGAGLIVEIVLTFIFVMTILGVTSKKANHGSFGGLIIGLTLTLVHIFGIGLTGTSVNPARSLGPALVAGGSALSDLWVFIIGPFIGAALAAVVYKALEGPAKPVKAAVEKAVSEKAATPAKKPANTNNNKKKKK
ncbi:MAG: MIP family channel protein [Ruminococcus sp.]|uniref:MIP/aquaporin family protein n=1 Tax=Ruminococcus sp. TaxID=41978 RepID=UPI0025CF9300|nr:MIP family channel protein [Ruminococcus sp.]MBR5683653.1 MIP family channel protein [Ruminococcus sp.]